MSAAETVTLISQELESQSLNAVVAGFSFAAALSWMDLVRWLVNQVVKVNKNGGMNYTLTALFTTLLSIVVYLLDLPSLHSCPTTISTIVRGHPLSGWLPLWN